MNQLNGISLHLKSTKYNCFMTSLKIKMNLKVKHDSAYDKVKSDKILMGIL